MVETTICIGTNGQFLATVPKSIAEIWGVEKGSKIRWHKKKDKLVGEVIV